MNADYTHITYVIDSSTSMGSVWPETISGLKEFVLSQKAEAGKCTLSLISFDTVVKTPLDFADIQLVTENIEEYKIYPSGCTALYDAVGKAIVDTGLKLSALAEADRPAKVVIVVQTDGEENSSKEYKASQISAMIDEQRNKYGWQFMFVGASESSVKTATDSLGFAAASVSQYSVGNTKGYHGVMNSKLSGLRSAKNAADIALATTYSCMDRSLMK